jgi:MmoB/DmpM family
MTTSRIRHTDSVNHDAVGPTMRAGDIADAVIDAIEQDNPGQDVLVTDRGDHIHVHVLKDCRLTRASLEQHLGRNYELPMLEIEMASFAGRMQTSDAEYRWYFKT